MAPSLAKIDAYHIVPVHPQDPPFQVVQREGDVYVDPMVEISPTLLWRMCWSGMFTSTSGTISLYWTLQAALNVQGRWPPSLRHVLVWGYQSQSISGGADPMSDVPRH